MSNHHLLLFITRSSALLCSLLCLGAVNVAYGADTDHFIIEVNVPANGTFTIPTVPNNAVSGIQYNYDMKCKSTDSLFTVTNRVGTTQQCSYTNAGTYTITIRDRTPDRSGFPRIFFNNSGDKDKITKIKQWGTTKWVSMEKAFFGCSNLISVATDKPDLSKVTNMSSMFLNAYNFNGDAQMKNWDVSNVTDMGGMFHKASAFNQPIGNWDVNKVTDMSDMFYDAKAFNQPIGNWNVNNVINMGEMFKNTRLTNIHIDELLVGWTAQGKSLKSNVSFDMGSPYICRSNAVASHTKLKNDLSWTITGDSGLQNCSWVLKWTGNGGDGNWSNVANWETPFSTSSAVVPTGFHEVVLTGADDIIVDGANTEVSTLTLDKNFTGTLKVNNPINIKSHYYQNNGTVEFQVSGQTIKVQRGSPLSRIADFNGNASAVIKMDDYRKIYIAPAPTSSVSSSSGGGGGSASAWLLAVLGGLLWLRLQVGATRPRRKG